MLVLSRKETEQIKIGHDITITIVSIGGRNVRIGVEAPNDMLILRTELINPSDPPEEVESANTCTA